MKIQKIKINLKNNLLIKINFISCASKVLKSNYKPKYGKVEVLDK